MGRLQVVFMIVLLYSSACSTIRKSNPGAVYKDDYDTASYDYLYIEGIKQKILGNAGEAIQYFEKAIEINRNGAASYFQIAQIASQLGDQKSSLKFAMKAADIDPDNIWYITYVANGYYSTRNLDSSILYYERAVSIDPDRDALKYTLATVYSDKGEYGKAEEILKYFDNKYGVNENSTLLLVRTMMNAGKYDEAEAKVQALLAVSPNEILYNGLLAEIYRGKGDDLKAIEVYRKLIAIDPENQQTLLSLADFFYTKKEYGDYFDILGKLIIKDEVSRDDKINLFIRSMENDEIIKNFSNNLEVSFLLLEAAYKSDQLIPMLRIDYYVKAGKFDRAEERLVQIIDENPENYYACEKLLLLYSETGENEKLFKRGGEFAEKFNRSFLIKILYASGATGVGEFKIAMAELAKAKILAGNQKEFLMQVYAMEADIYYKEGDFQKAFATYEEALKVDPDDIMILNNYAYFLSEKEIELQKALQMSKRVIEKERTSTYLDTYAWILHKQGKNREALKIMNEVIVMDNSDAELWEHLGFVQKSLRKCADAVVSFKKALDIDDSKNYLKDEIEICAGGR